MIVMKLKLTKIKETLQCFLIMFRIPSDTFSTTTIYCHLISRKHYSK